MKQLIKWSVPMVALALTAGVASAVPITGSITFDGGVTLDTTSSATATEVLTWTGPASSGFKPFVLTDSSSFATIAANTPVTFVAPWFFNTSSTVANFWSVGGFTFTLTQSHVFSQGIDPITHVATVSVTGIGFITGNGFDQTAATWSFSTQDPSSGVPATFSISAASGALAPGVPDNGTTVALLGVALTGLGLLKRKLVA